MLDLFNIAIPSAHKCLLHVLNVQHWLQDAFWLVATDRPMRSVVSDRPMIAPVPEPTVASTGQFYE